MDADTLLDVYECQADKNNPNAKQITRHTQSL